MRKSCSTTDLDALLPQTQCGECGYDGCKPYAKALAQGQATIDLCPPGGLETLHALADMLGLDASPYLEKVTQDTRAPSVAFIREDECIGCTKCIQACPVDAILGAGKLMHTVITAECTGCELCVAPCPVDCIDMLELDAPAFIADVARERFEVRKQRLATDAVTKKQEHVQNRELSAKQKYIQAAVARAKAKKATNE